MADMKDVDAAIGLYEKVAIPNELGLSPEIYEIYEKVILSLCQVNNGISRKDIMKQFVNIYRRPLQYRRLKEQILPAIESAGLILQDPNPDDRREMWVYCTDPRYVSPPNSEEHKAPDSPSLSQYVPDNSAVYPSRDSGPSVSPKKPFDRT
jgi:hypothetical protein